MIKFEKEGLKDLIEEIFEELWTSTDVIGSYIEDIIDNEEPIWNIMQVRDQLLSVEENIKVLMPIIYDVINLD